MTHGGVLRLWIMALLQWQVRHQCLPCFTLKAAWNSPCGWFFVSPFLLTSCHHQRVWSTTRLSIMSSKYLIQTMHKYLHQFSRHKPFKLKLKDWTGYSPCIFVECWWGVSAFLACGLESLTPFLFTAATALSSWVSNLVGGLYNLLISLFSTFS